MIKNNRCDNCGHFVTKEMLAKEEAYNVNDRFYICGKCYALKFENVVEYVRTHPTTDRKIITKCTGVYPSLIDMFCDKSNLFEVVKQKNLKAEEDKIDVMEVLDERTKKLEMLRDLKKALNVRPETSMQKVVHSHDGSKMRFLGQDHNKRF